MTKIGDFVKALQYAARRHKYQRRKDPHRSPAINHPINVAKILATDCQIEDTTLLQAAILHDTVEDTRTSFRDIADEFGTKVCRIVYDVTDDERLPLKKRRKQQIASAKKACKEAKLIKLAEKLDNLSHLLMFLPIGWSCDDRIDYFCHSKKVVDQLRGTSPNLEKKLDAIFKSKGIR